MRHRLLALHHMYFLSPQKSFGRMAHLIHQCSFNIYFMYIKYRLSKHLSQMLDIASVIFVDTTCV